MGPKDASLSPKALDSRIANDLTRPCDDYTSGGQKTTARLLLTGSCCGVDYPLKTLPSYWPLH